MNPDGTTVRTHIDTELKARSENVSAELLDAMTTLIVGGLRRAIPPSPDLEPTWQNQCIGWLVTGVTRKPHPEEEMRLPQYRAMLKGLFEDAHEAVPSAAVLAFLADIGAFAIYRKLQPTPGFVIVAVNTIGEWFREGRNPPWQ